MHRVSARETWAESCTSRCWSVEPTHAHPGVKCLEPACRCTCVASVLLHAQVGVADRVVLHRGCALLVRLLEASEHQHAEAVRHVRALNGCSCPQATAVVQVAGAVTSCWLHTQGLWKHTARSAVRKTHSMHSTTLYFHHALGSVCTAGTAVYRHVCY
jgi:hypothetical protein